ncbi:MAG: hypothetical protein H6863_03970 [Rhodospirillales bacterium]|nr:hypothetical protein [Rhodospirillales bacterium]
MAKKNQSEHGLLTQTDYAARRGVSRQYISKLIKEGVLPLIDGKVNPVQADAILEARREPSRQTHQQRQEHQAAIVGESGQRRTISNAELPTILLKTKIKSETEKAKLLEIKANVEAGKYVDIDDVRAAAFKQGRIVRDSILIIADRLAPVLANMSNVDEIHKLLTEEHNKALEVISKQPI